MPSYEMCGISSLFAVLLSLCIVTNASLAIIQGADGKEYNSILMSDIKALTFNRGEMTAARRSAPVPQLSCVGGTAVDDTDFYPDVVQCTNTGHDGKSVQWKCEADLPVQYRFGKMEVNCEGFRSPGDAHVLVGSCGLEYEFNDMPGGSAGARLMKKEAAQRALDEHEYQQLNHQQHHKTFLNPPENTTAPPFIVFFLIMLLVIIFVFLIIMACTEDVTGNRYTAPDRSYSRPVIVTTTPTFIPPLYPGYVSSTTTHHYHHKDTQDTTYVKPAKSKSSSSRGSSSFSWGGGGGGGGSKTSSGFATSKTR